MFANGPDPPATRHIPQHGFVSVEISNRDARAVRRKRHFVRPIRMAQNIGGCLRGHVPHFHGSVVASGVKLASIPGKENRFDGATMTMQKSGGDFQLGKVPEPDCVISSPAGQPLAIGGEGQIILLPVGRKVSERAVVGEAPHPDVTITTAGDEFASGAVECQEVNARGMTRQHVYWFEVRSFEKMNFSPKGAAGQIRRIRAEGETINILILAKAESQTKLLASLHVEDSDRTVSVRGSEQNAVP